MHEMESVLKDLNNWSNNNEPREECVETDVLNLNSLPSTMILENTNIQDFSPLILEEKENGEIEQVTDVENINISPYIELNEYLGVDKTHEMNIELPGYIIEFEPNLKSNIAPEQSFITFEL